MQEKAGRERRLAPRGGGPSAEFSWQHSRQYRLRYPFPLGRQGGGVALVARNTDTPSSFNKRTQEIQTLYRCDPAQSPLALRKMFVARKIRLRSHVHVDRAHASKTYTSGRLSERNLIDQRASKTESAVDDRIQNFTVSSSIDGCFGS